MPSQSLLPNAVESARRKLGRCFLDRLASTEDQRRGFKIQLIHPAGLINRNSVGTLTPCLPLGLAYIAAVLEDAGFPVSVIDAIGDAPRSIEQAGSLFRIGLSRQEIVSRIAPDTAVVGITTMFSFLWPNVRELIYEIKRARPDVKVVCGGEHFTALAEHSMREAPIDFIVLGEGEETVLELVDALAVGRSDLDAVRGLLLRSESGPRPTPPRSRIREVNQLPWPAWERFQVRVYDQTDLVNGLHKGMTVPIMATRGCPYECTYCSSPGMWTRRWIARDPVDVVDEIESYVRGLGATNFPFQDLTAIVQKDWTVRFCEEIIRRGLDIIWQFPSGTRCEAIDDQVASLLLRSGGRYLCYAPESGSERTRTLIKKLMKTSSLLSSIRASVSKGLNITILLVLGFPHDTWEDVLQTARLVRRLAWEGVDDLGINFFFPLPNTELYRDLLQKARIRLDDDFLLLPLRAMEPRLSEAQNFCESMSAFQLTLAKYWVLLNFYPVSFLARPGRFIRIIRNFVASREDSKLEAFLLELKRRLKLSLSRNTRRAA